MAIADERSAMTVVNTGVYAHDFCGGELRMTLLRSPAYCAHPIDDKPILPDDRYLPRIDIGERQFHFLIRAGEREQRLHDVELEALAENEKPFALSFFPSGRGGKTGSLMQMDNTAILLSAFKKSETGYILRLYNSTEIRQTTGLTIPDFKIKEQLAFGPFEVKTFKLNDRNLNEITMDERHKE